MNIPETPQPTPAYTFTPTALFGTGILLGSGGKGRSVAVSLSTEN